MRPDVARIAPDQEGGQALAPGNPRLEGVGVVVDVVDDKAGAGQGAGGIHRQEIDQKRGWGGVTTAGTPTRSTASAPARGQAGWSRPLCTEP